MKELVVNYLLQYQNCPLPTLGSLHLQREPATVVQGDNMINPPHYEVRLNSKQISDANFIRFIAANCNQTETIADERLRLFSQELSSLKEGGEISLPTLGKFIIDEEGLLAFSSERQESSFYQPVRAVRVIHQNDTHQILVGDTETNSRVMSDFYNEAVPNRIDRWWIWAIVFFIIASIAIFLYTNSPAARSFFGNAIKVSPREAPSTYRTGN